MARDYFALATACFERLESASDTAAYSDLKQMAHRSLEEAMKLLNEPVPAELTAGSRFLINR
jgi:hypothetical protein